MPPGLDDDYEYENFYEKNYSEKDLRWFFEGFLSCTLAHRSGYALENSPKITLPPPLDECVTDSHQEDGVGIIMKRRHLKCQELVSKKNKYDLDGFEDLIFNEDKHTYKHSRKKRNQICKIVKWCMTSDSNDNQIVDTEWVSDSHLKSDIEHIEKVDFNKFRNVSGVNGSPSTTRNGSSQSSLDDKVYNNLRRGHFFGDFVYPQMAFFHQFSGHF